MNHKTFGISLSVVFLALSFLTGCGGSSSTKTPPNQVVAITATTGSGQTAAVGKAFASPLVATVTTNGTPSSGVTVTFAVPASGATGTFAGGATTATTDSSGKATSPVFTAGTTAGSYKVTASAPGATAAASFSLTNTAGAAAKITATSGSGQTAQISTAFTSPLVATVVDSDSNPVSGVTVTFTAPASGASGTFAGATNVATAATNSSGVATSPAFTANATGGGPYTVVASATGATSANFTLTNSVTVTTTNYTFYMSGADNLPAASRYNLVALAGVVTIDSNGNVVGGEQDYNDAFTLTGGNTSTDPITGGTLAVDPVAGVGTLTLITGNANIGISGTETLAVAFVNTSHALIMQFDGTATSSGSMDTQTSTSALAGNFSFTMSGLDPTPAPIGFGGVFTISGTTLTNGTFDYNDAGVVGTGLAFTGTVSTPDSFGRGTITGAFSYGSQPVVLAYYPVGPEAIRIIDIDTTEAAIGSAFGQGSNTFTNASLGSSVLALAGNPFQSEYGALAQFTTNSTAGTFTGVGDSNELDNGVLSGLAAPFAGSYSFSNTINGYGSLLANVSALGDINTLGIYATDPALNLNDPNNSSGGGGALVLDLSTPASGSLSGGAGVLIPQSDNANASFVGNYVAGWQDFNYFATCADCEFDMVAQGAMTSGTLSLTGYVSDPFGTWAAATTSTGNTFTGAPAADGVNLGRYSMLSANSNPLSAPNGVLFQSFDVVLYQASGNQLFWLNYDGTLTSVFVGPLEQQGSLTGLPLARKPVKTQPKQKH